MPALPPDLSALIGQPVAHIDTPALVIDLDAMDRNITRMAQYAQQHGVRWRPHAKLHKSVQIAQWLERAGAHGHCVQKLSEAEALAKGGIRDLYISNQIIAPHKLARVAQLALQLHAQGGRLALAVDHLEGIARLAQAMQHAGAGDNAIDVLVEINVGQNRCGVAPGAAAVTLVQAIVQHPMLRFAGLQAYHGGAQHLRTPAQRQAAIGQALAHVRTTQAAFDAAGMAIPLVTGAGTGSFVHEATSGIYGELQAGSCLFMDADYAANQPAPGQPLFEHALFVKTQVMSINTGHAVCDAGHKAHAIDSGLPTVHGLPAAQALRVGNGGDEHGLLYPDAAAGNTRGCLPALGEILWLIPGHCDPTVNLHPHMVGVRGGLTNGTVACIVSVDARGALT